MTYLTDFFYFDNICPLGALILLCFAVGSMMVGQRPELNRLGVRIAGAAFIAFVICFGFNERPETAGEWLIVAIRGLLAAGLTLGIAWIVLTVFCVTNELVCLPIIRWAKSIRRAYEDHLEEKRQQQRDAIAQGEKHEALRREEEERERTAQQRDRQQRQAEARQKRENEEEKIRRAEAERKEEEREGPERRLKALHKVMTYYVENKSELEPWIGYEDLKRLAQQTIDEEPLSKTAGRRAKQLKSLIDLYLIRSDLRSVYICLWDAVAKQVPEESEDEFLRRTGYEQLRQQSMALTEEEFTSRVTSFRKAVDKQAKLLRRYYAPLQTERKAAEQQQSRELKQRLQMEEFEGTVNDLRQQLREEKQHLTDEDTEQLVENRFRHEPRFAEWKKWKNEG